MRLSKHCDVIATSHWCHHASETSMTRTGCHSDLPSKTSEWPPVYDVTVTSKVWPQTWSMSHNHDESWNYDVYAMMNDFHLIALSFGTIFFNFHSRTLALSLTLSLSSLFLILFLLIMILCHSLISLLLSSSLSPYFYSSLNSILFFLLFYFSPLLFIFFSCSNSSFLFFFHISSHFSFSSSPFSWFLILPPLLCLLISLIYLPFILLFPYQLFFFFFYFLFSHQSVFCFVFI